MAVPVLKPEQRWECPSCGLQDVTHQARPHTRMHSCKALRGFTVPMARVEGRELKGVTHRVFEREDFVGAEKVQLDGDGRPIMAIHVERDDGHDTYVYAPTASARAD
jgi:hypothetical protein